MENLKDIDIGHLRLTPALEDEPTTPHILSPVRRLPPEILAEIFLFYVGGTPCPRCDVEGPFLKAAGPLLPAQICREWRATAIATPKLWSRLYLLIDERTPDTISEILQTFLERSGSCPLALYIECPDQARLTFLTHSIISVVIRQSHRWEIVRLELPRAAYSYFGLIKGHLPLLTQLALWILEPDPRDSRPGTPFGLDPALDIFGDCPRLKSVELDLYPPEIASSSIFALPWGQLTACSGVSGDVSSLLRVLSQAVNLETCKILIVDSTSHNPSFFPSAELPNLHFLKIVDYSEGSEMASFFSCLTTPALKSFSFSETESSPSDEFFSFLSRSDQIENFHMYRGLTFDESHMIQLLRSLPNLLDLGIEFGTITDHFLNQLAEPKSGENYLVPKLQIIRFMICEGLDGKTFASMVRSRRRLPEPNSGFTGGVSHATRLQAVYLSVDHKLDEKIIAQMKELEEEGLGWFYETDRSNFQSSNKFLTSPT